MADDDALKKAEQRGYGKGYRAGLKHVEKFSAAPTILKKSFHIPTLPERKNALEFTLAGLIEQREEFDLYIALVKKMIDEIAAKLERGEHKS